MFENRWCLATVKAPLCGYDMSLFSCKISQNVCTSFLLEIIYSNYLRNFMSKHPYQYLFWNFSCWNCTFWTSANFPKPYLCCFQCQIRMRMKPGWFMTPQPKPQCNFTTVCHCTNVHISASVSVQSDIRSEMYLILQQWITSSITDLVPVRLIQPMNRKNNADELPHQISISVYHSCHDKSNMLWLAFTSCAMTSAGVPVLGKVFWLLVQWVLLKLVPII